MAITSPVPTLSGTTQVAPNLTTSTIATPTATAVPSLAAGVGATTTGLGTPTIPTAAPEVGGLTGANGTSLGTPGSTLTSGTTALTSANLASNGLSSATTLPTSAAAVAGSGLSGGVGSLGALPATSLVATTLPSTTGTETTVATPLTTIATPLTAGSVGTETAPNLFGEPVSPLGTPVPAPAGTAVTSPAVTGASTGTAASPALGTSPTATGSAGGSPTATSHSFDGTLVPLNGTNIQGAVALTVSGQSLTVDIRATGLEAGHVHVQTLDAMSNGTSDAVPTSANDTDHDGFIEQAEAAQTLGQPILALPTDPQLTLAATGSTLGSSLATFPQPDANGTLVYHQVFTFAPNSAQAALLSDVTTHLSGAAVVLQGLTVPPGPGAGTPGEVNGTNGYLPQLPVAVGLLHEVPAGESPLIG